MRHAARVDASQAEIVAALRAAGASVQLIGLPVDALVGFRGVTHHMEFKTKGTRYGRGPNRNQQEFMAGWLGAQVVLVDTPEAALNALGVI